MRFGYEHRKDYLLHMKGSTPILRKRGRSMFKKILYPTDFSDVAMKAFEYVKKLKITGAEEVVILHVLDQRSVGTIAMYIEKDVITLERNWEESARKQIAPLAEELERIGYKVKVRIEEEVPFRDILKVEDEEDVSLIVMGSHGRSNVEEMLLGSVSEKIVRKAKKPILIIKR